MTLAHVLLCRCDIIPRLPLNVFWQCGHENGLGFSCVDEHNSIVDMMNSALAMNQFVRCFCLNCLHVLASNEATYD